MLQEVPSKHRAWRWYEKGDPQSLRLEVVPVSALAAGEVLVFNRAIGINPVDWKMVEQGHPDWQPVSLCRYLRTEGCNRELRSLTVNWDH
jgi:hypothetical protein